MRRTFRIAFCIALISGVLVTLSGCGKHAGAPAKAGDAESRIRMACSSCHSFPEPGIASEAAWRRVLPPMIRLSAAAGLDLPDEEIVYGFFGEGAAVHSLSEASENIGAGFSATELSVGSFGNISFLALPSPTSRSLFAGDVDRGGIYQIDLSGNPARIELLMKINVPVHVSFGDIDGDGLGDLIATDIGQLLPEDIDLGQVVALRGLGGLDSIATGLGRAVQCEAIDLDEDGDLDLAVADFGYERTGGLSVYWNQGAGFDLRFEGQVLDERPGVVAIDCADIDGDGRVDLIAAIAQHHEEVAVYLNRGDGLFEKETVFKAPHPAWGLMGVLAIDIDGDGDRDVVSVNGDHLDGLELKTYHGAYLSTNDGRGRFKTELLAPLPGAARVKAADLDGDFDPDLILTALISPRALPSDHIGAFRFETLVWLENVGPSGFRRHVVAVDDRGFSDVVAMDIDGDGALDLAASCFDYIGGNATETERAESKIRFFRNRLGGP